MGYLCSVWKRSRLVLLRSSEVAGADAATITCVPVYEASIFTCVMSVVPL